MKGSILQGKDSIFQGNKMDLIPKSRYIDSKNTPFLHISKNMCNSKYRQVSIVINTERNYLCICKIEN